MRITFHQMCNNPAEIPEFDNLYLDMNGIIHQCSHPNDEDVHFRISEEKIFADIFHYLEVLFRIIKPMKVFFMAVDGVAPRAKMNQQRGRRFRSAKEAEDKIKKALEKGETLPTEARFDSNCITPGYINDNGNLNLVNFEKYLEKLSEYDREHFNEVFVDLKWFESKVGNKYLNEAADFPDDDHEDEDLFETEFRQYKRSYYMTKMGVEVVSDEFLAGQAECYVLAIQWILHYYYHGVQSWSWYYPYHYAPYLSDIRNFSKMKLLFDMGKPFLPFEQLLGVLPAASKDLLPKVYQDLMISEDSPIIEYYPLDFKTDLNGKQQEWEAVVLIPFIDEFYKKKNSVQVFQQSSRGESMMLEIMPSDEDVPRCEDVASLVLGKSVFVNWPHLEEARVVAVSDGETKFFLEEPLGEQKLYTGKTVPPTKVVYLSDKEQNTWLKEVQGISEFYNKRKGIVINETAVLLFAQLLTGRKYVLNQNGEVHLEKQWSKQIIPFVYQAVVKVIARQLLGLLLSQKASRRIKIPGLDVEPYRALLQCQVASYMYLRWSEEAQMWLTLLKQDLGVVGDSPTQSVTITRRTPNFMSWFPEVFSYVSKNSHDDVFYEDDIWPGEEENGAERVHEITAWLKAHAVSSSSRASCDQQILDTLIVEKIEEELEKCKQTRSNKKVRVTVKPHLLFRPLEQHHGVIPDKDAEYHLFDRVVNVRESFSVPLGLRGTVIGIKGAEREAEVLYEVLFDKEFAGGLTIRCSPGRGYRLPPSALVNLTHGSRLENGFQKLTAIVKPQTASVSQHSTYSATTQKVQIGGLNHSPRSPFVPTQSHAKEDEFSNVWQSLQGSGNPHNPPQHWQENSNKYGSGHQSHNSVKGQQRQKQEYLDQQGYSRKCRGYRLPPSALVNLTHGSRLENGFQKLTAIVKPQTASVSLENGFQKLTAIVKPQPASASQHSTYSATAQKVQIGGLNHSPRSPFVPTQSKKMSGVSRMKPKSRCSPGRGYRLPPSALVNLTHGSRLENGFQKLTAIVKPQTASVSQHSTYSATAQKVQIGGLNHSPRSPFVPTQSHAKEDEFSNVWQSLQGSGNPHNPPQHWQENSNKYGSGHQSHNSVKGQQRQKQEYLDQQGYSRKFKEDVRSQQNEAQEQSSGGSERQNIRVLKRNEDYNAVSTAHPSGSVHTPSRKAPTEFEELMANLKISKGNETQPAQTKEELSNEEPLSPQSFAMKGTLMLKEMLKIDSSSSVPADKDKQTSTEAAYPANTTAHHSRRRSTKKLAAHINTPHVAGAPQHGQGSETSVQHHGPPQPPVPTVVTELSRVCASLGMSQPEFGYLRTPQGMAVCQVKLSSGLLVHGPQCQSENEAEEKAALFALQRLSSVGSGFPLPQHMFSALQQIRTALPTGPIPSVFGQPPGNLMMHPTPHGYGPMHWGAPVQVHGQPFYPGPYQGNRHPASAMPIGTHNQFVPLQVTKKRATGKKNYETREYNSSQYVRSQKNEQAVKPQAAEVAPQMTTAAPGHVASPQASLAAQESQDQQGPSTPRQNPNPNPTTPGSSAKRRPRKLAVNFDAAKVSE
ncbi:UNVERIFIED_CONTAM: hypothetical protein FKN15_015303 [Acipenser sinensis]